MHARARGTPNDSGSVRIRGYRSATVHAPGLPVSLKPTGPAVKREAGIPKARIRVADTYNEVWGQFGIVQTSSGDKSRTAHHCGRGGRQAVVAETTDVAQTA